MPRPEKVQAGPDDYDVLMNRAARESARVQIAFNEQTPNQEKVQKAGGPRAGSPCARGHAHTCSKKSAASGTVPRDSGCAERQNVCDASDRAWHAARLYSRSVSESPEKILTARQREVIQLLAEGKSMKEAADFLKVTPRTVAFHKYRVMEELEIKTSADLVQFAIKNRIVVA
jgi:DNA-binding CsgD family transcriptional regulator